MFLSFTVKFLLNRDSCDSIRTGKWLFLKKSVYTAHEYIRLLSSGVANDRSIKLETLKSVGVLVCEPTFNGIYFV